jgi:hypothetical protein
MVLPKSKQHVINLGLVDYTPEPRKCDTYESYLDHQGLLGRGFAYRELVKPWGRDMRGRFREPPRDMWARMVPTLALANEIRLWMREGTDGARGLRVAAAFRPRGGARMSQHKRNAALDLDLLPGDYHLTHEYYRMAVRLWCEYGRDMKMGLGLYCSPRRKDGIRIHIDTGYRARSWQISGKSHRPYLRGGKRVPLAVALADEMGLVPPSDEVK